MFADGHLHTQLIPIFLLLKIKRCFENFVILLTWIRIRIDQILWIRIRIRIRLIQIHITEIVIKAKTVNYLYIFLLNIVLNQKVTINTNYSW